MNAFRIVEIDPGSSAAQHCLSRYYAELNARFAGGFEVSQSRDPDAADLRRPHGAFLVAFVDEMPVGCIGLKGQSGPAAEIKRMWIDPEHRGLGLARKLMERAEAVARELAIEMLRLDTNSALPEAIAVYRHWGWTEIPRFNDDPYAQVFFEKAL